MGGKNVTQVPPIKSTTGPIHILYIVHIYFSLTYGNTVSIIKLRRLRERKQESCRWHTISGRSSSSDQADFTQFGTCTEKAHLLRNYRLVWVSSYPSDFCHSIYILPALSFFYTFKNGFQGKDTMHDVWLFSIWRWKCWLSSRTHWHRSIYTPSLVEIIGSNYRFSHDSGLRAKAWR